MIADGYTAEKLEDFEFEDARCWPRGSATA